MKNLFLLISLSVVCVYSQTTQGTGYLASPEFCCNTQSDPQVQVTPNNMADIVNDSPNYEHIATPGFYNQGVDNICHTYFLLGDNSYLRMTSFTFSNGTVVIEKYILAPLTGYPGVGRFQGLSLASGSSTIVFDEVFLGSPCPAVRVYYRKYIAGSCNVLLDEITDGIDTRHGDANTKTISDCCLNQIVSIANSQNFNGSQFVKYPYKLNSNCVTQVNGMSCVNANKVPPQDAIAIPDTGSSCQTLFY